MAKRFKLSAEQIRKVAPGHGACYASDRITCDGLPVRWMYREAPDFDADGGWRFYSGTEDEAHADDPSHFAIYDVNTVANYDPTIIPHLGAPVGSAFEKPADAQDFVPVADWAPEGD